MRYSDDTRKTPRTVKAGTNNAPLFQAAEAAVPEGARRVGAILLVGGADHRSVILRETQAAVRFDQRPSRWSHVAVVADWSGSHKDALGLEASFDPVVPARQVPERNGVTSFPLSRYLDGRRYPNLCLATFTFADERPRSATTEDATPADALPPLPSRSSTRAKLLDAMRDPNRQRTRFPIHRLFAPWSRFLFEPHERSPLLDGIAVPSAAYVESVFVEAGIDLVPSATAPNVCPEHVWASLLHWMRGQELDIDLWLIERQRDITRRTRLPGSFETEIPSLARPRPPEGQGSE